MIYATFTSATSASNKYDTLSAGSTLLYIVPIHGVFQLVRAREAPDLFPQYVLIGVDNEMDIDPDRYARASSIAVCCDISFVWHTRHGKRDPTITPHNAA